MDNIDKKIAETSPHIANLPLADRTMPLTEHEQYWRDSAEICINTMRQIEKDKADKG